VGMPGPMSADDETPGIRGDELADDAGEAVTPIPEDELADGGVRGDGLPDDADTRPVPPDDDGLGEDGVRGDGLANDA
jgi:hypothetical protein